VQLATSPRQKCRKKLALKDKTYRDVVSALESPAPSPVLPRKPRRVPKAERAMNATYRHYVETDKDGDDDEVRLSTNTDRADRKRKRVVDATYRPLPREESDEELIFDTSPKTLQTREQTP